MRLPGGMSNEDCFSGRAPEHERIQAPPGAGHRLMPFLCVMRPNGHACQSPVAPDSRIACPPCRDTINAEERAWLRRSQLDCDTNPPGTKAMFSDDDEEVER